MRASWVSFGPKLLNVLLLPVTFYIMSIYRYIETKYLGNFVTMEIMLVPPDIVEGTKFCGGVRTTQIEWH